MRFSLRAAIRASLLCSLLAIAAAPQLHAEVVPPIGLAPGSQYQLAFVTADTTTATEWTEAYYNGFVSAQAAQNPSLPAATWSAITSTADGTSAKVNAPWLGLPVYDTTGKLIATPASGFYGNEILAPISGNQFGDVLNTSVWTGSDYYGNYSSFGSLGTGYGNFGLTSGEEFTWLAYYYHPNTAVKSLYALSGAITLSPVPEPASLTMLAVGAAVLGGMQIRRRRRQSM